MAVNEEKIIRIIGNFAFARNTINSFDCMCIGAADSISVVWLTSHHTQPRLYNRHTTAIKFDKVFDYCAKLIFVDEIVNALNDMIYYDLNV